MAAGGLLEGMMQQMKHFSARDGICRYIGSLPLLLLFSLVAGSSTASHAVVEGNPTAETPFVVRHS